MAHGNQVDFYYDVFVAKNNLFSKRRPNANKDLTLPTRFAGSNPCGLLIAASSRQHSCQNTRPRLHPRRRPRRASIAFRLFWNASAALLPHGSWLTTLHAANRGFAK
jgi:hypothetical protein